MTEDAVRVVLRLRTLGPSGLNPPQTEVVDRLRTLVDEGPIVELDADVWGGSMGVTQTEDRDPDDTRETVAEYEQWAAERGCTLRPAFEWRSTESTGGGEGRHGRVVTPLITLAVHTSEGLQAVYPHVDDGDVRTIHDGIEALESMARDAENTEGEIHERPAAPLQMG